MNLLLVLTFKISYFIYASQIYNLQFNVTILYTLYNVLVYNVLVYNILYIWTQNNAYKIIFQRYIKKYGIV